MGTSFTTKRCVTFAHLQSIYDSKQEITRKVLTNTIIYDLFSFVNLEHKYQCLICPTTNEVLPNKMNIADVNKVISIVKVTSLF